MRSCDQAPETSDVILERGDNCVKSFKKRFREQPIVRLGTGSIGTVFSVYSQKRDDVKIAVKVLPYGENLEELANRELGIACELNSLKRETPVFVRTIGYIICHKIPPSWKAQLVAYQNEALYMLMFMGRPEYDMLATGGQYGAYQVSGFEDRNQAIALLFMLFHAIYVARKELGFVHKDLHPGNVMFAPSRRNTREHQLNVEGTQFRVSLLDGGWTPKIIDFGSSSTTKYPNQRAMNNGEDIKNIVSMLQRRTDVAQSLNPEAYFGSNEDEYDSEGVLLPPYKPQYRALMASKYDNPGVVADFLLNDLLFEAVDTIEKDRKRVKRDATEPIDTCVLCGNSLESDLQMFEGREGAFCRDYCHQRVKPLGPLFPFSPTPTPAKGGSGGNENH